MSKVTSKLQVTIPKRIASQYQIQPGDEIQWVPAGDTIRVSPAGARRPEVDTETRLKWFDLATERQMKRQAGFEAGTSANDRGWKREELYARGGTC